MKKKGSIKYHDPQNWLKRPSAYHQVTLAQKWGGNAFNLSVGKGIFVIIFWKTLYNMLKTEMNTPFRQYSFLLGWNKSLHQGSDIFSLYSMNLPTPTKMNGNTDSLVLLLLRNILLRWYWFINSFQISLLEKFAQRRKVQSFV